MRELWNSPVWNVITAVGTIVAAGAAAWAAREAQRSADVANSSVRVSKRTADLMETEMQLAQRAWVGVQSIKLTGLDSVLHRAAVQLDLKNGGLTPALKTRMSFHLALCRNRMDEVDVREMTQARAPEKSFPPGASFGFWRYSDHALTGIELNELRTGVTHLYFVGVLEYEDIFGNKHVTEWAFEYDPKVAGDLSPLYFHNTMN